MPEAGPRPSPILDVPRLDTGTSFRKEQITISSQLKTLRDDTVQALLLTATQSVFLAHQSV